MADQWTLEVIEKLLAESEYKRGADGAGCIAFWAVDTLNRHHRDIIRQLVRRVKELEAEAPLHVHPKKPFGRLAMTDRIAEIEQRLIVMRTYLKEFPYKDWDGARVAELCDEQEFLLTQLRERENIIRELWDFIDTYGYADNSGEEYRPACIACGTSSQKHEVGCELEKILASHHAMQAGKDQT